MVSTDNKMKHLEGEGCLGVVEPDTLVYNDSKGIEHTVHIPNGTFEKAVEIASIQDWDSLESYLHSVTN